MKADSTSVTSIKFYQNLTHENQDIGGKKGYTLTHKQIKYETETEKRQKGENFDNLDISQ